MIRNCLVITIIFLFSTSCKEAPIKITALPTPKDSKIVHVKLVDTLGEIVLAVPVRYDTFFLWIDRSDCGKPCETQKYRFQPKDLRITEESGFFWTEEPKDSVERFTISHSGELFPRRGTDTAKDLGRLQHLIDKLRSDPSDAPIVFDTIEKINDRYFSIIEMERSDTIQSKKVLAVTTINGNELKFQYELLTKKRDSIGESFFKNSVDLIRTIRIGL